MTISTLRLIVETEADSILKQEVLTDQENFILDKN